MITIDQLKFDKYSNISTNIKNISFPDTGLFLITGKNGSGKSTFLEVLSGLIQADSLMLSVNGRTLSKRQIARFQEENVLLVHQSSLVFDNLTCLENLLLPFAKQDKEKARECLKQVELEKLSNQKASELSSGEKQRLSFARVLYDKRKVCLLDEVTSNLDPESTSIIESSIQSLSNDSLVLFVTHENSPLIHQGHVLTRSHGNLEGNVRLEEKNSNVSAKKKRKDSFLLSRGIKRNFGYYLTLFLFTFLFTVFGSTLSSLGNVLSYDGVNPDLNKIKETTYLENAAAFYCSKEDNPSLEAGEWFYAKHEDVYGRNPDIGTDFYDLALIPTGSSFQQYSISLAKDEKENEIGRYPENPNEIRISDYSYSIYCKRFPALDRNGIFEKVSSLIFEKNDWHLPLTIVGVYQGREWNELDKASVKARKKGYKLDTNGGTYYYFLQDTLLGMADPETEKNQEYYCYYLLNTTSNREFRKNHRKDVHLTSIVELYNSRGVFYLVLHMDGTPGYSNISYLSAFQYFGLPVLLAVFVISFSFRIAFIFRNKKKYLLLRSRGYKRKNLFLEDSILHFLIFVLSSVLSFGVSELIVYLCDFSFSSNLVDAIAGRSYFPHRFLLPYFILGVAILVLVFALIDLFFLLKKDRTKESKELKEK